MDWWMFGGHKEYQEKSRREEVRYRVWTRWATCEVQALRDPDGRYTKDFWWSLIVGIHEHLTKIPFGDPVYKSVGSLVEATNQYLEEHSSK